VSGKTAILETPVDPGNGHVGRQKKEETKQVRMRKETANLALELASGLGMDVAEYLDAVLLPVLEKDRARVSKILRERADALLAKNRRAPE